MVPFRSCPSVMRPMGHMPLGETFRRDRRFPGALGEQSGPQLVRNTSKGAVSRREPSKGEAAGHGWWPDIGAGQAKCRRRSCSRTSPRRGARQGRWHLAAASREDRRRAEPDHHHATGVGGGPRRRSAARRVQRQQRRRRRGVDERRGHRRVHRRIGGGHPARGHVRPRVGTGERRHGHLRAAGQRSRHGADHHHDGRPGSTPGLLAADRRRAELRRRQGRRRRRGGGRRGAGHPVRGRTPRAPGPRPGAGTSPCG